MDCPSGQFYSTTAKRCLRRDIMPMSKGHSQSPCPDGQVWNPAPEGRRCIRKNVYEMVFGAAEARAASSQQKKLRGTRRRPAGAAAAARAPVVIAPAASLNRGITPAAAAEHEFEAGEPRVNAVMPPGLTRAAAIEWLGKQCKNKEDPVTLEDYADADLKDLRSLVRLGSGFCYTADVLDTHIKSSIERDVPVKDMLNPSYRLNARDFGAVLAQGKTLRKTYKLPSRKVEVPADHYKLYIGVVAEPEFKYVFLYDERKVKKLAGGRIDYTPGIPQGGWLGYLPVAGTGELEKLIKKAYKAGRLFNKATRPFGCCRVHVKKSKEFWSSGVAGKIAAMEEELRGIL